MATFNKDFFSPESYASWRPDYPGTLYKMILDYHYGPLGLALDLGTGHATVARQLAHSFERVIGTDVSVSMIQQATKSSVDISNLEFRQSAAESSPFLQDGQVDMVTGATCAHWFDYPKLWPEMARIVRPGGTIAVWAYMTHVLVDYPKATRVMEHYLDGMDEGLLGPYWPQPGHNILSDYLRAYVPPKDEWCDVKRFEYDPGNQTTDCSEGKVLVAKKSSLQAMAEYIRTWSACVEWQARWPERKPRSTRGHTDSPGDIIDEMLDKMCEAEPALAEQAAEVGLDNVEVNIEYRSVIVLARRR